MTDTATDPALSSSAKKNGRSGPRPPVDELIARKNAELEVLRSRKALKDLAQQKIGRKFINSIHALNYIATRFPAKADEPFRNIAVEASKLLVQRLAALCNFDPALLASDQQDETPKLTFDS